MESNDVPQILQGYREVPNPLLHGWRWWVGPWIENGIQVFRPIASYLLWFDCWLAEHFGSAPLFVVGLLLFISITLLSGGLAWRLTQSRVCVLLACSLSAQARNWNYGGAQPKSWLAWFPVHHDLLFIALLLGAILLLDLWLEQPKPKHLIGLLTCLGLGLLTKEYTYIFPVLAAAVVGLRRLTPEARQRGWVFVGAAFLTVIVLYLYRKAVLPDPYNPLMPTKWHMLRKPFLYWFYPFYRTILIGNFWLPGLALLLVMSAYAGRKWLISDSGRRVLARPFGFMVPILAFTAMVGGYLQLTTEFGVATVLSFLEGPSGQVASMDLFSEAFTFYVLYLIWKYRREEPGILALLLMMLIYLPVWTYLGWHYSLPGWFVRAGIWWPVVLKLVWRDVSGYLPQALALPTAKSVTSP